MFQHPDRVGAPSQGNAGGPSKGEAFLGQFINSERRIFAYIYTLVPNRDDAEEVLQEVSKILWQMFDAAAPPDNFLSWACRIAFFEIKALRRTRRRQRVIFSDAMLERVAETASEHADVLRLDERHEALACYLGKLGERDRDLLAKRFEDGATVRSVAESVGRSVDAVYKALARVRRLLCNCVERTLATEGRQ
jgi:RNA polymerase sigma-70 factor (ECF subfamily)